MSESKKWYTNWWVTLFIAPLVVTIGGTLLTDAIKAVPILTTLSSFTKAIRDFIVAFLNFPLKLWWMLLALVTAYGVYRLITAMRIGEPVAKPVSRLRLSFMEYKQARFKNWIWQWDYYQDKLSGKWSIIGLTPFCPRCKYEIIDYSNGLRHSASCRCNTDYTDAAYEHPAEIEKLIVKNVAKRVASDEPDEI